MSLCWAPIGNTRMCSSRVLREPTGRWFLKEANDSLALLGSVLWLLHPKCARVGCEVMEKIRNRTLIEESLVELGESAEWWPTPFTTLALIANKESAPHRDNNGIDQFYDILTTIGNYNDGRLRVPGIGIHFMYNPGTVVAICGKALQHAVAPVNGDRVCLAQYFQSLAMANHARNPGLHDQGYRDWMTQEDFEEVMNLGDVHDLIPREDYDDETSSSGDE